MRHFMTLVESLVSEVDLGGEINTHILDRMRQSNPHKTKAKYRGQGELFPGVFPDLDKAKGPLKKPYKAVGAIGDFTVALKGGETDQTYVLLDQMQPIAWVSLREAERDYDIPDMGGTGFQVSGIHVHDDYRGQRLGLEIFRFLLTEVCDYLICDDQNTKDGAKLWERLIRSSAFEVWVYDHRRGYSRERRVGKDFNAIYNTWSLIPWVTLKGRGQGLQH